MKPDRTTAAPGPIHLSGARVSLPAEILRSTLTSHDIRVALEMAAATEGPVLVIALNELARRAGMYDVTVELSLARMIRAGWVGLSSDQHLGDPAVPLQLALLWRIGPAEGGGT